MVVVDWEKLTERKGAATGPFFGCTSLTNIAPPHITSKSSPVIFVSWADAIKHMKNNVAPCHIVVNGEIWRRGEWKLPRSMGKWEIVAKNVKAGQRRELLKLHVHKEESQPLDLTSNTYLRMAWVHVKRDLDDSSVGATTLFWLLLLLVVGRLKNKVTPY